MVLYQWSVVRCYKAKMLSPGDSRVFEYFLCIGGRSALRVEDNFSCRSHTLVMISCVPSSFYPTSLLGFTNLAFELLEE